MAIVKSRSIAAIAAHDSPKVKATAAANCKLGCLGVLTLVSFVACNLVIDTFFKHHPLYVPIFCNTTARNMETKRIPLWRGGGIVLTSTSTMTCSNPNALVFRQEPESNKTTPVYILQGSDTIELTQLPARERVIPANAEVNFTSSVEARIKGLVLAKLLASSEPVLIATETHSLASVEMNLYGLALRSPPSPSTSWCGFHKDLRSREDGPTSCASSLDVLKGEALPASAPEQPFKIEVPEKKLEKAERVWTILCVSLFAFFLTLSGALLCLFVMQLRARNFLCCTDRRTACNDSVGDPSQV